MISYPIYREQHKIKINPGNMVKEKLYYCNFNEKLFIFYKDHGDLLNCFEINEPELINKIKICKNYSIEETLENYIKQINLKH